jgi:hypothetical protein
MDLTPDVIGALLAGGEGPALEVAAESAAAGAG